jgi:hypothetical protein
MIVEKTKKSKGVTISFQEFSSRLEGDNTTSGNVVYAEPKKQSVMSSWADEVEEDGKYFTHSQQLTKTH